MAATYERLNWPRHKPRTKSHERKRAAFSQAGGQWSKTNVSMQTALDRLFTQIDGLDRKFQTDYTLTLETPFGRAGYPLSNRRTPEDCGVAVYFTLFNRPVVLACDKWDRVEDNIVAIAKHIEALRGQERWGVATTEEAFAGHMALPPPMTGGEPWYLVMNLSPDATVMEIKDRYRKMAKQHHSDAGGDNDRMSALNVARDQALRDAIT